MAPAPAADQDKLVIPVQLPPAGQVRPMAGAGLSGHGPNCPQTQVSGLLGVQIGQPHGVILGHVSPTGPAGKAGLKAGDSIIACNGAAVTCPATLLPMLRTGEKPTTVKLTVLRAKSSTAPAAKPAPSPKPAARGAKKPALAKKPSRNTDNQNQAQK
jgi:predicted metalloprotease with PDZ domain